jgi:hypothetical protein
MIFAHEQKQLEMRWRKMMTQMHRQRYEHSHHQNHQSLQKGKIKKKKGWINKYM